MSLTFFVLILFGYVLGSIPFGYLISRTQGIDIRTVGSGNIGATNVSRKLGIKWGMLVGLLDFTKAAIPTFLAVSNLTLPYQIILVSLMPVVGHLFSIWLGFRGGKGIGATFGMLFILFGWQFFILWFLTWIILLKTIKIMSLVNLLMVITLPFFFWYFFRSSTYIIFSVIFCIIIFYAHRENIKRLIQGKEFKLSI